MQEPAEKAEGSRRAEGGLIAPLGNAMLPIIDQPPQRSQGLLGHPLVPHDRRSRRPRKGHKALDKVDVEYVNGHAPLQGVLDGGVEREGVLCAPSAAAAAGVAEERSPAQRRQGRMQQAPLRELGTVIDEPNVAQERHVQDAIELLGNEDRRDDEVMGGVDPFRHASQHEFVVGRE